MLQTASIKELQDALSSNGASVLDVRSPGEFRGCHVNGTRNIPLTALDPKTLSAEGLKDAPVYLLCLSGVRARNAGEKLEHAGFTSVHVAEGGLQAWLEAGLPVTRGKGGTISIERQVRIGAGTLVLAGIILGFLINPAFYALSAFVGGGLVFAGITDWCGMGLLLAKAPWNR